MPQLARIDFTFITSTGTPVIGATVQVRKQGAQIRSGGPNVFTVDDPGALAVNDNCVLGNTSSPVRAATAVGATSVTVGAGGFTPTVDDDRISVVSPLATIYSDAQGNDVIDQVANPLTTDNDGRVICYAVGAKYDILATAPGSYNLQPKLVQDFAAVGAESFRSNVYPSGSAVGWNFDTLRTLVAGDKAVRFLSAGLELFSIDYGGSARILGNATVLGASGLTVAATITGTGGFSITGNSTLAGILSGLTGLTVASGTTAVQALTSTGIVNTGTISSSGALTVTAGGAAVTGNSSITGSLSGVTGLTCQAIFHSIPTLTVNSTTPTVSAGTVFAENNTSPTSITDFIQHNDGQEITIIINTTNTTFVNGATLKMAGGVNFNPNGNDVVRFVQWGGVWYETGRSVN